MNEVQKIVGQAVMVMEDLGVIIEYDRTQIVLKMADGVDRHKLSEIQQVLSEHKEECKLFFEKLTWLRAKQEEWNIEGEGLLINYKDFSDTYEQKLDRWCFKEKLLREDYDYTYCIKGIDNTCNTANPIQSVIKCDYCLKESENQVDISNIVSQLPDDIQELF